MKNARSTPAILYSYTVTHFSKLQCSSSNISRNLNFIRSRILAIFGRQVKGMADFQNFKFKKTIKQSKKPLLIAKCISDVYWLMWNWGNCGGSRVSSRENRGRESRLKGWKYKGLYVSYSSKERSIFVGNCWLNTKAIVKRLGLSTPG